MARNVKLRNTQGDSMEAGDTDSPMIGRNIFEIIQERS